MQADPGAELAERGAKSVIRAATSRPRHSDSRVEDVDAIRARVLRDDEQLAHAGAHEPLGFAEHVGGFAADKSPRRRGMMQKLQR